MLKALLGMDCSRSLMAFRGGYVGADSYVGVGSSEASGAAPSTNSSSSYQSNTHVTAFGGGASSAEDYYESNSSALAGSLSLAREQQTKEALRQAQDIVRRSIIVQVVAVILTETRRLFEPLARSFAAVTAQNFGYCHGNSVIQIIDKSMQIFNNKNYIIILN